MYQPMTPQEYAALMIKVAEARVGEEFVFACNAAFSDHLHVRRCGDENGGLEARLGIWLHDGEMTNSATVFLSARETRALAAYLLNIADEIDGVVPLFAAAANTCDPLIVLGSDLDHVDDDEEEDDQ